MDERAEPHRTGLARLLRPGLVANIGANGLGQIFQVAIQLISVPVYAYSLGLENYGVWLLFATLPAYLLISDFGLTAASGNDMTVRIARHDRDGARTTFQAMVRSMLVLTAGMGTVILAALGWIFPGPLTAAAEASGGKPFGVLCLILLYSFALLGGSVSFAAFRAVGEYSVAAYRMQWLTLIEAVFAMAMALAGQGLLAMAAALAMVRGIGSGWLWLLLRARHPFFFRGPISSTSERCISLFRPAMAAFALPVSHLLVIQGSVGLIGLLAGPAAVPAFAATRTVTRTAVQVGMTVNFASLPNFTAAHARGEKGRMADLIGLSLLAAAATLLPATGILLAFGSELVAFWTQQRIVAPDALVLAMGVSMIFHGCWLPLSNLLLAINQQSSFSWFYLLSVLVALAAAVVLVPASGAVAMAWLIAGVDGLMLFLILWRAVHFGVLDRQAALLLRSRGRVFWHRTFKEGQ